MEKRTKKDVIAATAMVTNKHQVFVGDVLTAAFDYIVDCLERGDTVTIGNFGRFEKKANKARVYKMPHGKQGRTKTTHSVKFYSAPRADRQVSAASA